MNALKTGCRIAALLACSGCACLMAVDDTTTHRVPRIDEPPPVDADWQKAAWREVPELTLIHHMEAEPTHRPVTAVKLAYGEEALRVIFRVEDRYVRVVNTNYQDGVYKDSCVEFFFTPGTNVARGYFNLELNGGGTAYFSHRESRKTHIQLVTPEDFERMSVASTLPDTVDPEITNAVTWSLECSIPYEVLERYTEVTRPAPGVTWKANFYKCGDKTSHPHWITWAPIDNPRPDFHRPEFFGTLQFE